MGIPEILYNVIYSRPRVARTAAASSASCGREQHESRPRVADFFLAWRMTLALRTAIYIMTERCRWTVYFRVTGRVLKIQKIQGWQRGDSVLAAEFSTGSHNRLLRRQHCSSLCSQSEGHEHVADIASALGHIFVGFLAVFVRHNIRPPHFASKVSYSASPQTFAECSGSASCCYATCYFT